MALQDRSQQQQIMLSLYKKKKKTFIKSDYCSEEVVQCGCQEALQCLLVATNQFFRLAHLVNTLLVSLFHP